MTTGVSADSARLPISSRPLSAEELRKMNAYWRAANYLSVGQIYLYANRQLLGHKADSTSINGQIGLFAQNAPDHVADIIFNNVKVWSL